MTFYLQNSMGQTKSEQKNRLKLLFEVVFVYHFDNFVDVVVMFELISIDPKDRVYIYTKEMI